MSPNGARRRRLHAENPNCHWCGVLTVLETPNAQCADMATIDHVIDREHAKELGLTVQQRNEKSVLACYRCNQRRNRMGMKGRLVNPRVKSWGRR